MISFSLFLQGLLGKEDARRSPALPCLALSMPLLSFPSFLLSILPSFSCLPVRASFPLTPSIHPSPLPSFLSFFPTSDIRPHWGPQTLSFLSFLSQRARTLKAYPSIPSRPLPSTPCMCLRLANLFLVLPALVALARMSATPSVNAWADLERRAYPLAPSQFFCFCDFVRNASNDLPRAILWQLAASHVNQTFHLPPEQRLTDPLAEAIYLSVAIKAPELLAPFDVPTAICLVASPAVQNCLKCGGALEEQEAKPSPFFYRTFQCGEKGTVYNKRCRCASSPQANAVDFCPFLNSEACQCRGLPMPWPSAPS
jgi:hypothetical protein